MHFRAGLPVAIKAVAVGTESPPDFGERVDKKCESTLGRNLQFQARLSGLSSRARAIESMTV